MTHVILAPGGSREAPPRLALRQDELGELPERSRTAGAAAANVDGGADLWDAVRGGGGQTSGECLDGAQIIDVIPDVAHRRRLHPVLLEDGVQRGRLVAHALVQLD